LVVLLLCDQTSLLRDGSEVSRDSRSGDVLAEIPLQSKQNASQKIPVFATGSVFDVECRNANTGEGSFMAVTKSLGSSTKLEDLTDSLFVDELTRPTGRFSFYGTPTDMKVRNSITQGDYRVMELSFSILAQSTQAELPRRARLVATIPAGTQQAVMLVGSASATRWKQGSEGVIAKVVDSFRAIPAPSSSMRMRAKERRST
jgi:butyrate kinase